MIGAPQERQMYRRLKPAHHRNIGADVDLKVRSTRTCFGQLLIARKELMTDFQNLKYESKNHIAYITIDRPKVLNALNMATMQEIKQAFASAKDDAEVRVVILTGSGEKAFVAG